MARIGRWTSSAPAQSVAANTRTLITMPAASMVATDDEFIPAGMPRWDGTRIKSYASPQHPESLDITWVLEFTMPQVRRALVAAVPVVAGQTITAATGGLLNITASALGTNIVGAAMADGSPGAFIGVDDYVGDPAATVSADATVRGGTIPVRMSPDGPLTTRQPIDRINYNPKEQWGANGLRLYLTSPVACSIALRILNIRQTR